MQRDCGSNGTGGHSDTRSTEGLVGARGLGGAHLRHTGAQRDGAALALAAHQNQQPRSLTSHPHGDCPPSRR